MKWLAEKYLRLRGWAFIGEVPPNRKFIIIGAPHTSNWDFVVYLAAVSHWNISPKYLGKHTLFDGPFGWVFRGLGGISVDRSQPGGLIDQVTNEFAAADELVLAIAPEGTRNAAPFWKSGFLAISRAVGVPIVPGGIDYVKKQITLGNPIEAGEDVETIMTRVRTFYEGKTGKNPQGMGPIRVQEESASTS